MKKIITVMSTKGGVGKSTLTRYLATSLNELKYSVCIIDTCQNASISVGFMENRDKFKKTTYEWLIGEAKPSEVIQQFRDTNIYFIPANELIDDYEKWVNKNISAAKRLNCFHEKVKPLIDVFDFILIDTHPNENSDLVSYAIRASDLCIIPFEIDLDSVIAVDRSVAIVKDFMEDFKVDYAIVPNKVSPTNGKIKRLLEQIKNELSQKGIEREMFLSEIRHSDVVQTSKLEGKILSEDGNRYAQKTMDDYRHVTKDILNLFAVIDEKRVDEG
jgi:cellulose biosynthesis protein BcsQ